MSERDVTFQEAIARTTLLQDRDFQKDAHCRLSMENNGFQDSKPGFDAR